MDYRSVAVALLLFALAVLWLRERSRAAMLTQSARAARSGPHAYDPDRPAGLRVTLRKR